MHHSMQRLGRTTSCIPSFTALLVAAALGLLGACAGAQTPQKYAWTSFVQVDGQPEPVPEEWVSTPEGKFAHSIKIPNPVPKDSGYRPGMSSEEYFKHLCETEAGEFIYKTVENVEGFYFMRPPKRPTDEELKDRYALEDPSIERIFQLVGPTSEDRAKIFVNPPWSRYVFVEEPMAIEEKNSERVQIHRIHGYRQKVSPMQATPVKQATKYGVIWRGIIRPHDREKRIAGSEMIILDLETTSILAVRRNFVLSPKMRNVPTGVWWLNASSCGIFPKNDGMDSQFIYKFAAKVLKPIPGEQE